MLSTVYSALMTENKIAFVVSLRSLREKVGEFHGELQLLSLRQGDYNQQFELWSFNLDSI